MQVILYYSYLCYPYNKTKCTYMIAEADSFFKEEYIEKLMNVTLEEIVEVAKKVKLDTIYFLTGKEFHENN